MSFKWQIKFRLIIHFSANFLNNQRQVDDARIMVGEQFHMMTIRQLCRFCQRKRRGGGDNVIILAAVQPQIIGVNAVSQTQRLYGTRQFSNLLPCDASS